MTRNKYKRLNLIKKIGFKNINKGTIRGKKKKKIKCDNNQC